MVEALLRRLVERSKATEFSPWMVFLRFSFRAPTLTYTHSWPRCVAVASVASPIVLSITMVCGLRTPHTRRYECVVSYTPIINTTCVKLFCRKDPQVSALKYPPRQLLLKKSFPTTISDKWSIRFYKINKFIYISVARVSYIENIDMINTAIMLFLYNIFLFK